MSWKQKCKCGKFDFVFGEKPDKEVEVICPKCRTEATVDPAKLTEVKEKGSDN
jgi:hypothetical protein